MRRDSKINGKSLHTKEQLKAEIVHWAAVMKVNPMQIRVQRMTKKWASCSSKGRVCFSADILQEAKTFQEFVIIHELLHLQVPNHGKLFKSLMNAYLPGWENILAKRNGSGVRSLQL
jgi:predicted metal-dependent hydrolase